MRIYSDMDGYIANFIQRFIDWFELPVHHNDMTSYDKCFKILFKHTGLTKTDAWDELDAIEFWSEIDQYEWFDDVVEAMNLFDKRWTIMTSIPPRRVLGIRGKQLWLEKYLPKVYKKRRMAFVCGKKYLHARPDAILIDDSETEIEAFKRSGGNVIPIPQPWNKYELPDNYYMGAYVWESLKAIKARYESRELKKENILSKVEHFIDLHSPSTLSERIRER